MSLMVHAYRRDPTTRAELPIEEEPIDPWNDLAGFEPWRQSIYSSASALRLGLTLLPSLARQDIYAESADLDRLQFEVELLLGHLPSLVPTNSDGRPALMSSGRAYEPELEFRLRNILEAIRIAKRVPDGLGGVYIG